jgi:hypothetical protein
MEQEQIKKLALASGFKLKEQEDGSLDLNEYVYTFAKAIIKLAESLDTKRIDWLASPNQNIGNVQLPSECVERNIHCLRSAIDEAMSIDN